jgi:hypothetical protein
MEHKRPTLSPEDENRYSFGNAVFFRISDDGQVQTLTIADYKTVSRYSTRSRANTYSDISMHVM